MINTIDNFFLISTPFIGEKFLQIISFFADPKLNLLFWGILSLSILWKKRLHALKSNILYFFILTNSIMLICGILKILIGRARPFLLDENIAGFYFFSIKHAYLSFPSSHSALAIAFAHSLKKLYKCSSLIYLFPILIAATRTLLRAHFATDILAGLVIGWILSTFLIKFYKRVTERLFFYLDKKKLRSTKAP